MWVSVLMTEGGESRNNGRKAEGLDRKGGGGCKTHGDAEGAGLMERAEREMGRGGGEERRGIRRYTLYNMQWRGERDGESFWLNVCLLFTKVEQNLGSHEYS